MVNRPVADVFESGRSVCVPQAAEDRTNQGTVHVLLVDRDPMVHGLYRSVLETEGYEVSSAYTPDDVRVLLTGGPYDLLVGDVLCSGECPFALLTAIRQAAPDLPIVLVTANVDAEMVQASLQMGACDYVPKPCTAVEIPVIIQRNLTRHAQARRRIRRHQTQLQDSYETVLGALISALDIRTPDSMEHTEFVTACAILVAQNMGLSHSEMYDLERGALLHDVGKIGVPDHILFKPGPLTPTERTEMQRHPEIGFRMCARIDFLKGAAQVVLHHHERWDGGGYPDGLAGDDIPLGARILCVADAFHAMTSERPYRHPIPVTDALVEVRRCSSGQFDPRVVSEFLKIPVERWEQIGGELKKTEAA